MRGEVLEVFPKPPGLPEDKGKYLWLVKDIYRSDAYHSLSIEGYSVSPELVKHLRAGNWDPGNHDAIGKAAMLTLTGHGSATHSPCITRGTVGYFPRKHRGANG